MLSEKILVHLNKNARRFLFKKEIAGINLLTMAQKVV